MAKKVNNHELLAAIRQLETKFDKKFEEIAPYIGFLSDLKQAGRAGAWGFGLIMGALSLYIAIKKAFLSA